MIGRYQFLPVLIFMIAVSAGCTCCATAQDDQTPTGNAGLHEIFDAYFQSWLLLNPIEATGLGVHDYDHLLPVDISESHRESVRSLSASTLDHLAAINRAGLSQTDRLNYDILKWTLRTTLRLLEYPDNLMPVNQMASMHLEFARLGSGAGVQPFETPHDFKNFMGRMRGFSLWVDTAIANMKRGVKGGYVLPEIIVKRVLPQLQSIADSAPEESVFVQPLEKLPSDTPGSDTIRAAYLKEIRETVLPAYARLLAYMRDDYLPHTRSSSGLDDLPEGKKMYREWIRYWTTTDMSPQEIHELGLHEAARIRGELDAIQKRSGYDGSLEEYVRHFYRDPHNTPFKSASEILDVYADLEKTMAPNLDRLFRQRPETAFEVRQIEAYRAASASAHYQPGSPDGSRPGVFYVPIFDPTQFSRMGMESLFAHEAIPGHHYQISLQQESSGLPGFRNAIYFAAFTEGWALYSERLGKELGLYTEEYSDVARLNSELFRAVRLVVDTGLHADGWTREQSITYMVHTLPGWTRAAAANQVERYMVMPAQALAYKIGELAIGQIRSDAETSMGKSFDIRDFHDRILLGGSMPLSILNSSMRDWMKSSG